MITFQRTAQFGPGYRVYFSRQGRTIYLLLGGGTKGTQKADIRKAQRLANLLKAMKHEN